MKKLAIYFSLFSILLPALLWPQDSSPDNGGLDQLDVSFEELAEEKKDIPPPRQKESAPYETLPDEQEDGKASTAEAIEAVDGEENEDAESAAASDIPAKKRPRAQDKDKIEELDEQFPDSRKENADTLKYGMEEDIISLLDSLIQNEDVRFTDEAYDLFQDTKNPTVREKILEYFTKLEDPCLEDYAVAVLSDPFDEKKSTVEAVFKYVQAVKTKEAAPAVLSLIENEDEDYFASALATIGEIGGADEAVYLSGFLEREDLSVAQRQQLVRVLGKLKAVETYSALAEMAQDEDENAFVRMYAAEAIGAMGKEEAVGVLAKLYEDSDPKIRSYAVRGLAYFPKNDEAKSIVIEAIRDTHVSVRLEAIEAARKNGFKEAVPYMVYRLEKDKEDSVKRKCYPAIAELDTDEGNEYLVGVITDKKAADNPKSRAASALLEFDHAGTDEIIALARETLKDDRRKALRYSLGKDFAKYARPEFSGICIDYLESKDTATQGTGLDIYAKGRYSEALPAVRSIILDAAKTPSKRNANAEKAKKILGSSDQAVKEAEKMAEDAQGKKTQGSADAK